MIDRILRRPEVERVTGLSRTSIYALIAQGRFPRPVKLGRQAVGWRESEIAAWIESRPAATTPHHDDAA